MLKAKPAAAKSAPVKPKPVKFSGPLVIAKQGFFFVGGQYTQSKDGQIMVGQMFVQFQIPQARKHKYPIIMIHGGGQTGTNFLGTPDGQPGWAEYFLRQGYTVYVVDQPGRARSGYFTDAYGPTRRPNASAMSERFTLPENSNLYPQAKLHTQWPGKGVAGDPVYDQFFASQVEDMQNLTMLEDLNRNAVSALLDKIGPSILLTHSQSGPFGWGIADLRPKLVKAVCDLCTKQQFTQARQAQENIAELAHVLKLAGFGGLKAALKAMGRDCGRPRPPVRGPCRHG